MSWKEKRLITILSIILAVLCAAVLVVLSIRYRAAQAAKDQNTVSPSDIAEAAQSEYVALSYSNGSTTLSFSLNEDGIWTWDSEPDFPLDDTHVKSILTILETLKPQQTLDMPEDLSVYGLDVPDVSLTATAPDDAVLTVTLGNATTDGTSYYATINSDPDHVFILAGTLRQAMQTPIYQMCRLCGYGLRLSGCGGLPVCHRGKDGGGLPGVYRRTVLQHHLRRRGRAALRGLLPPDRRCGCGVPRSPV